MTTTAQICPICNESHTHCFTCPLVTDRLYRMMKKVQDFSTGRGRGISIHIVDEDDYDDHVDEGVYIHIHTRNGGGNSDEYSYAIDSMQSHPWYKRSYECDYDYTYMDFLFEVSSMYKDEIIAIGDETWRKRMTTKERME